MSANSSISSDLITSDATVVIPRKTRLAGFIVFSDGTNLATVTLYDSASAKSGVVLAKALANASQPSSIQSFDNPVKCDNGIVVGVSGTGAGVIVYYDA
jgi:hypothetical protein